MGGRGSKSRLNPITSTNTVPQGRSAKLQMQMMQSQQTAKNATDDEFHIATPQDEAMLMAIDTAYDSAMRSAQDDYINPVAQSNGYGFGQNLNHDMVKNGAANLTGREQQVYNTMMQNMTPIGTNLVLNRATHDGIINKLLGVRDYQSLSDSQLNARLAGIEYTDDKFVSTAFDSARNPFTNGGPVSGGREVYMNIRAPSWTPMVIGDKKQAELVLQPGLTYRITGAHYNGQIAYPQKKGAMKRIVVDVEIVRPGT